MVDNFGSVDWQKQQSDDSEMARVVDLLKNGFLPRGNTLKDESPYVQTILRDWKKFHLLDGVLYRTVSPEGQEVNQLVLPKKYHTMALKGVHDDVGHQGKEKTLWLARQRFYWPKLERDVNERVETRGRCQRRKTPVKPRAKLVPIHSTRPLEIVCIYFVGLER
ncbi:hypothetical protein CI610_02831 [invertebrate metagenome]|uniref:Integrase zinc-binding domain-containing protein n=1 Tax=invertebrate metagenome TaxID=1711999 RepID=A0A2H9T4V5_9ZZZZ